MGRIGLPELLIILAIVVVIFGANRLPGLGKGIGSAIKNFKEEVRRQAGRGLAPAPRRRSRRPGRFFFRRPSTFGFARDWRGPRAPSRTRSRISTRPSSICRCSMFTRITCTFTLSPSR